MKTRIAALVALGLPLLAGPALAGCQVVGDSVAVGVGRAMGVCAVSARIGISSTASAASVRGGGWVIASIGSNDFPRGISVRQRVQSVERTRRALASAYAAAGGQLILLVPANGARGVVSAWAAERGVRAVSFSPGRDGIHPRDYGGLARQLRAMIGS